ncbi:MAG: glycyl-radical enzyme activating protein [Desulfamplus sp.]|nr:glycyl-radical enzyme activating protein [Desulfamplus sp.]
MLNYDNCIIFDIKKYAIHDGPGIRTTIFFKGCPLSCRWCHNPEGLNFNPTIVYDKKRCIGCMFCIDACPRKALSVKQNGIYADSANLNLCDQCSAFFSASVNLCDQCLAFFCADVCPTKARESVGKIYTIKNLLEIIEKDIPFYENSGGGVTFSGGEPLSQWRPLLSLLQNCRKLEIHTAVDTTGFVSWSILEQVAEFTDLFLFDLKIIDDDKHKFYTGVSNKTILENLKRVSSGKSKITIRIPVIPSVNDDDINIDETGKFIASLVYNQISSESGGIQDVNLLPYHDFQESKYRKFGIDYKAQNILPPTQEQIKAVQSKLESFGLVVNIG